MIQSGIICHELATFSGYSIAVHHDGFLGRCPEGYERLADHLAEIMRAERPSGDSSWLVFSGYSIIYIYKAKSPYVVYGCGGVCLSGYGCSNRRTDRHQTWARSSSSRGKTSFELSAKRVLSRSSLLFCFIFFLPNRVGR